MVSKVATGCTKGGIVESEKLHGILGLVLSLHFGYSCDVDGCPGVLQFTQKDSC